MAFHTVTDNQSSPAIIATAIGVANAAGGSAGATVSTNVTFTDQYGNGKLPGSLAYAVNVTPSQAAFVTITNKSPTGFTVVLTPQTSGTPLTAGSFDLAVLA
jgi:hypothetical protein